MLNGQKGSSEMRDRFNRFMQGRYGTDQLSRFLGFAALILIVLSIFTARWRIASALLDAMGLSALLLCYFRMFSRDIAKRSGENRKFLELTDSLRDRFGREKYYMNERKTNHIYSCPGCGQKIRIPKGKGKIEIECPKCHTKFVKRS